MGLLHTDTLQQYILATLFISFMGIVVFPLINKLFYTYFFDTNSFKKSLVQARDINEKLLYIRDTYGALRVFVMCYHNGGNFYTKRERQKLSMVDEVYNPTLQTSLISVYQDLPINYFSETALRASLEGIVVYETIESVHNTTEKSNLREHGVRSKVDTAIFKSVWAITWDNKYPVLRKRQQMVASVHVWLPKDYYQIREELTISDVISINASIEKIKSDILYA